MAVSRKRLSDQSEGRQRVGQRRVSSARDPSADSDQTVLSGYYDDQAIAKKRPKPSVLIHNYPPPCTLTDRVLSQMRLPPCEDAFLKDEPADDHLSSSFNPSGSPIVGRSQRSGDARRGRAKVYGQDRSYEESSGSSTLARPHVDSNSARLRKPTPAGRSRTLSPKSTPGTARRYTSSLERTRRVTLSPVTDRGATTDPPVFNTDSRDISHQGGEPEVPASSHTNTPTPSSRTPDHPSSCHPSSCENKLKAAPQYPNFTTFLDSISAAFTASMEKNTRLCITLHARGRELQSNLAGYESRAADTRVRLRTDKAHQEQVMSCFTGWPDFPTQQRTMVEDLCQEVVEKSEERMKEAAEQYQAVQKEIAQVKEERALAEKERAAFCAWAERARSERARSEQLLGPGIDGAKST